VSAPGPIDRAVRALGRDQLVVYPTDTLLGLGARADRPDAVGRLVALKGRPPTSPLSFMVGSYEALEPWAELTETARAAVRTLLPGPYTLLVPASPTARRRLAPEVLGGRGTVGIRIPDHPVARALARRAGPVVSTSANLHGSPPVATVGEARRGFGAAVVVYLPARPAPTGRPSSIVDLTGERPTVHRRG
jgi:L-threonylcarbamoyladenylate synthase